MEYSPNRGCTETNVRLIRIQTENQNFLIEFIIISIIILVEITRIPTDIIKIF